MKTLYYIYYIKVFVIFNFFRRKFLKNNFGIDTLISIIYMIHVKNVCFYLGKSGQKTAKSIKFLSLINVVIRINLFTLLIHSKQIFGQILLLDIIIY